MPESQVTEEIKAEQPEMSETIVVQKPESSGPMEFIVDLGQADKQVPTELQTPEEITKVQKEFVIESTTLVRGNRPDWRNPF